MRVLFVIPSLAGGGAEKLINDLVPLLSNKGIECDVLIFTINNAKYLDNLINKGINVIVMPEEIYSHYSKIRFIKKIIKNGQYDIIHANLFPAFYYCGIIKMFSHKFPKLVMTEHSTDNRRRHYLFLRPLEKIIYNQFNRVICISNGTLDSLLKWLHVSNKNVSKFSVIFNGVPLKVFIDALPYNRFELFGFSSDDIILCMVGSFTRQKNHLLALNIIKQLPNYYKLVLVGEGPLKKQIEELVVNDTLLKGRVVFLGFRLDVARIIKTSDISLIPSIYEGFGLVAVEAMACGRPVVASNVSGLSFVVDGYGFLADLNNVDSYVRHIRSLEDKELYNKMVELSIKRSSCFSIDKMMMGYYSAYQDILK